MLLVTSASTFAVRARSLKVRRSCAGEKLVFDAIARRIDQVGPGRAYPNERSDSAVTPTILGAVVGALFAALRPRAILFAEKLGLRQQLAILRRATPRPRLRPIDRAFWVIVSRLWSRWAECLAIVQPATVIGWHRRGFARWWAWKSRPVGRPPLAPEL